ncbi:MAG TPA: carboxypeptidase-like regulatory domain-containing protein [Chitinophagaceae bacterium]|nr:carboxypeptidase-like regulatory domain-containing protein [Chitinophagaceae bacterium]
MQKLRIIFLSLLCGFSFFSHAQFIVTGTILDSASREPLPAASVFCQNTTQGTVTNKQGEFSLSLKSGGYDLIITYTGYQTQIIRVSENIKLNIVMIKEEKNLGEVVLKSSNEVTNGWEKYGDFFTKNFIGATPNAGQTVLLNPEVLKFYYYKRSNKLKVLATDMIQIANNALGYNLHYHLDSFVYYYNTNINSYRGFCLYSEMEGNDSLKKVWSAARAKAYYGSKLHFMRSYYDSTLAEDGWAIDMLENVNDKNFTKITNVYDSSYYNLITYTRDSITYTRNNITYTRDSITMDSVRIDTVVQQVLTGAVDVEIYYPRKIRISYTKKKPEPEYLKQNGFPKNVGIQITYVDLRDGIVIMENGYYYDQRDWINQGYWSWKNVADLLPYDYLPD